MPNMKIQIASDLHLEGRKGYMPEPAAFDPVLNRDLLVLAGDIGTHLLAQEFVLRELELSPVIYVPGNHEYYTRRPRSEVDRDWTDLAASEPDLHYLIAEGVTIDGVRFWGAPWYSDLWGADPQVFATVRNGIMDFWPPVNGDGEWKLSRHINHHLAQTELLAAQAGRGRRDRHSLAADQGRHAPEIQGRQAQSVLLQRPGGLGADGWRAALGERAHA